MKHAWLAVLIVAGGCVDLKSSYPDRKFYTLAAERPGTPAAPGKESVLRVRRLSSSKVCEGSELAARTGDAVYDTDFYHAFFVPPAMQVTEQAHRWLGRSGLFSAVVGTGSSVPETHILEGNLVALHADRRDPKAPAAVMEIQFMLARVANDPVAVLFQKTYPVTVPLAKDGPESVVEAWNQALGKVLGQLESDLGAVDRSLKK